MGRQYIRPPPKLKESNMLKAFGLISVGLFVAVYWAVGAFVNAMMALWLFLFPANLQPAVGAYTQLQDVQLTGSTQLQAAPTQLQKSINVQ